MLKEQYEGYVSGKRLIVSKCQSRNRRPNGPLLSYRRREVRRLQSRTQTPRLRLLGLDTTHPPPALPLRSPITHHAPFQTLFRLPNRHETRHRHGFARPTHLRPRDPGLDFCFLDDFSDYRHYGGTLAATRKQLEVHDESRRLYAQRCGLCQL